MNYAAFLAGALRGGTHVHVFSPDNSRLSFTYNDHVMHEYDSALDLRNVAIAIPYHTINVGTLGQKNINVSIMAIIIVS